MPERSLAGIRVAILVSTDFEQAELEKPRKAFEEAGATTKIIAPNTGPIQGMNHDEKADKFDVDLALDKANPDDFDAILLPGGALNADFLRVQPKAQEFVKAFDAAGKPMAIICHAPWLLVSAGLVKGRKMTGYHTIQDDLRNAGATWVDQEVVLDRNWVMSRQPDDIPAFNREAIKLFAELRHPSKKVA
jgi:protease I